MSATVEDDGLGAWSESLDVGSLASTSMAIPGEGAEGPMCGIWAPTEFCDGCGEPDFAPNHCGRRECPNCEGSWTRERAVGIGVRLGAARLSAPDGSERRAIHAVFSPPEGEVRTLQEVRRGFRSAYDLAKKQGVRGGVAVFHGYRPLASTKDEFEEEADAAAGIWRYIKGREEHWRDLTYWSPHWHVVGLSLDFEADDPDEQDGWVARRIRSLDAISGLHDRGAHDDVVGLVRYLMSHATFDTDSSADCVRWFGGLATTNFAPDELGEGRLEVLERVVDDLVGADRADGGDVEEDPCEECGSTSRSPIWDAGYALQDPGWCRRIGREQERRLKAAFEWAIGEVKPPPGMQRPATEEECAESFAELL